MTESKVSNDVLRVAQALGRLLSLDENHKMERVRLIKTLWAADRLHLRKYGRTITQTDYYAMKHGPVNSLALDIARLMNDGISLSNSDEDFLEEYFTADNKYTTMQKDIGTDHLSATDIEMLDRAFRMFKDIPTFTLADEISHKYPEWVRYEEYFKDSSSSQKIHVDDFFENPKNGDDPYFSERKEKLESAREVYLENREIENLLDGVS